MTQGSLSKKIREHNIFFHNPASHGDQLPSHHKQSFQQIIDIASIKFQTYTSGRDDFSWKIETKARAEHLRDTVLNLARKCASEYQWRLELEPIVYERFGLTIECPAPGCNGRRWKSEVNVIPEIYGPISLSLEKRRKARRLCRCSAEKRLHYRIKSPLSRVFDYRADEIVLHGADAQFDFANRPDRVQGLQATNKFNQYLEVISRKIEIQVIEQTQMEGASSTIQFTPFKEHDRPLMFPFLISEAKTERGHSFEVCEEQTAFPIWRLLRLQEELQTQAEKRLFEQGGPLVWFFANRGESWRLYGCYIDTEGETDRRKPPSTSYNIIRLWQGCLDTLDGALQILLLIDYIFDWARDLYRPGVIGLLKSLSRGPFDDNATVSTDSAIPSIRHSIPPSLDGLDAAADLAERIEIPNWLAEVSKLQLTMDYYPGGKSHYQTKPPELETVLLEVKEEFIHSQTKLLQLLEDNKRYLDDRI